MSVTTPDPSGGPHRQSHATVVLIDPATGAPVAPLADAGTKATAIADLAAGGTGIIGWLSQIWAALTGTIAVSGPATNAEIRASALQISASQLPETLGGKTAAQSLAVTLSADGPFSQNFGATSDAAATTDTGTFSLLALVKRGMQNWTSLFARLPASLGAKTAAASISIAPASDATFPVEPLGTPSIARQVAVTIASANQALTATCRRVSIRARTSDMRYSVGAVAQTASATTSHFIGADERLDIAVPLNAHIAVIRDSTATADGTLCISELT